MSFEAVPENSQRCSWGDVGGLGRQTVPEAASSHRKRTIANSGQPCSSDHQLWGWRRPETAAVYLEQLCHRLYEAITHGQGSRGIYSCPQSPAENEIFTMFIIYLHGVDRTNTAAAIHAL